MQVESEIRVAESRFNKDRWKANEVRALLANPSDLKQGPCFICGQHEGITVLHHVLPVAELACHLNGGWINADEVSSPVVWLCPNCHRYVHEWMDGNIDVAMSMPMLFADDCLRSRFHHVLETYYEDTIKMLELQIKRTDEAISKHGAELELLESKMKEQGIDRP